MFRHPLIFFLSDSQIVMSKGRSVPWAFFVSPHSLKQYHLTLALLRRVKRFRLPLGRDHFHEVSDFLRRTSLYIVGDMRIGIGSELDAEVTQYTRQRFHIHAAGEAMVAKMWCRSANRM